MSFCTTINCLTPLEALMLWNAERIELHFGHFLEEIIQKVLLQCTPLNEMWWLRWQLKWVFTFPEWEWSSHSSEYVHCLDRTLLLLLAQYSFNSILPQHTSRFLYADHWYHNCWILNPDPQKWCAFLIDSCKIDSLEKHLTHLVLTVLGSFSVMNENESCFRQVYYYLKWYMIESMCKTKIYWMY